VPVALHEGLPALHLCVQMRVKGVFGRSYQSHQLRHRGELGDCCAFKNPAVMSQVEPSVYSH